jgi:hypothetical protein
MTKPLHFSPDSAGNDPVHRSGVEKTLQADSPLADACYTASHQTADPVSDAGAGVCTDAPYPLFFPSFTPTETGYQRDWWWFDESLSPADVGPFDTREDAAQHWGTTALADALAINKAALDDALASLPPWPSDPDPDVLLTALDALDAADDGPVTITDDEEPKPCLARLAGLSLLEDIKRGEVVRLAEQGLAILTSASPADRAILAGLEMGRLQGVGTIINSKGVTA